MSSFCLFSFFTSLLLSILVFRIIWKSESSLLINVGKEDLTRRLRVKCLQIASKNTILGLGVMHCSGWSTFTKPQPIEILTLMQLIQLFFFIQKYASSKPKLSIVANETNKNVIMKSCFRFFFPIFLAT